MRILLDLQCLQIVNVTQTAERYVIGLLDALLPTAEATRDEIHLLLNGADPATIPSVQRRYPALEATKRIHVFHGLTSLGSTYQNGNWRRAVSELLRDFAIASLSPDVVLVPVLSKDSGIGGSWIISEVPVVAALCCSTQIDAAKKPSTTQSDQTALYLDQRNSIRSADALLAVSEFTRGEALERLGFPEDRIRHIPGDADARFRLPDNMSLVDMQNLRARHALFRPYLLHVGVADPKGSLARLIRAYSNLPRGIIDSHDLVLVCEPGMEDASTLYRLTSDLSFDASRIRILNNLSEADLPGIYGLAELSVLLPSSEGFALPALETIRCGTLVLGSNAASLPEVIGTPEALFEPNDISGLTSLIMHSLTDKKFHTETRDRQMRHAARFSWATSARETLSLLAKYAQTTTPERGWCKVQNRLDALEHRTIEAIKTLPDPDGKLSSRDRNDLARALLKTRLAMENAWRPHSLPKTDLTWRLEGPFDSNYSLASVNRETARALGKRGVTVALVSAEGDGPFEPDPDFLEDHPDLAILHETGQRSEAETVDILGRNLFPPNVSDMRGPLNILHGYAWEETGLPQAFSRDMTAHLQGLLVTSPHVKKVFGDAGIGLPVHVVGNGVDHLDVPPEPLPFALPQADFTCLHVSSCFPRKGPDILLTSFAEAFDKADDVQLVIKTFPNPHNDIADRISVLREAYPNLPPITVIEDPLTPGQMRSLYAAADLLIAPSRAEGYCLPVAEAVLAGIPVLTTGWGGQKVFSGNPLVHFIDYRFSSAQSHLGAWDSVWAEPDQTDLINKLKALRTAPAPSQEVCASASRQILAEHTWDKVAERSEDAVRDIVSRIPSPPPRVGWVSSFNTRCGIATYSAHLIEAFPDQVTVFASQTTDRITSDNANIRRCWQQNGQDTLTQLQTEIRATDPQVLVIQFNYGFFSFPHLAALILQAKKDGRKVVLMLHATDDSAVPPARKLARIRPALDACDRLLVHSHHDLNHLKSLGLEDNVALFPHGVPNATVPPPAKMNSDRPVVLGSYGFFLPPKGLDQLIDAVAQLRNQGENVALEMINAEFPIRDSVEAIEAARQQIRDLDLDDYVNLETRFLEDAESFSRLARADALVFSYQRTAESASGAIRQALALDRPVLATPLRIFDDVEPLIMRLPGTTAEAIAQGLKPLIRALRNPDAEPSTAEQLAKTRANANLWRQSHAYQVLGPRLWRQICSLAT